MSDVYCAKCGEPWDGYSLQPGIYENGDGDLTKEEAERFRRGEGCPCCKFGTECPVCSGRGKRIDSALSHCECGDTGRIRIWRPARTSNGYSSDRYYNGYSPNVRAVSADLLERFGPPRKYNSFECRDGWVHEYWLSCPDCTPRLATEGYECEACKGTGKPLPDDDLEIEAARSECDASDEDPIEILQRRGLA